MAKYNTPDQDIRFDIFSIIYDAQQHVDITAMKIAFDWIRDGKEPDDAATS